MDDLASSLASPPKDEVVLYLSFDGCLHHGEVYWHPDEVPRIEAEGPHRLFEHACLLEKLLDDFPQVRIVLSSAWVEREGYLEAKRRLPLGLQVRCIGATFSDAQDRGVWRGLPRGEQVTHDAERRKLTSWFALDEDAAGWQPATRWHLIRTNYQKGISPPEIQNAIRERLASLCKTGYPDFF